MTTLCSLGVGALAGPAALLREVESMYAPDMLIAAAGWLDAFNWLAEHPCAREGVCAGLEIADRPARVMLGLFTAWGLLREKERAYELTELARDCLVRGSCWDLGPFLTGLRDRGPCRDLLGVLRSDRPVRWRGDENGKDWAATMGREDFAAAFLACMDSRGAYLADRLAEAVDLGECTQLLDIGGGSGLNACALACKCRGLRAAIMEKPPVDDLARRAIAARGLAGRVIVLCGDMLADSLPPGYDVHLFSNVLHDWEEVTVRRLLRSSFQALPLGGTILIHDCHLDGEGPGPIPVAEYSVLLMAFTEGRCYAAAEVEDFLRDAGFVDVRWTPTGAYRSVAAARKPGPEGEP